MQLLLMLVICLAFFPYLPAGEVPDPLWSLSWTVGCVAGLGLLAEALSWFFSWRLHHRPARRQATLRWYHRCRLLHLVLTLTVYVLTLFWFGWGVVVRKAWGLERAVLLDELLILAPFIASLSLEWLSFYRVEKAIGDTSASPPPVPFWGRWAYLWFHLRHYLGLVLAPILLFTAVHETLTKLFPTAAESAEFQLGSVGLLMLILLLVTPWLLAVLWNAKPLPAGPLRDRLEAAARRLRFRYTDILLWNTRGGVANAMVTGVFRIPRYVLLSDALVQGLRPEEVEAVFGHEIGHVKHHHMMLYLCFMILSLVLLGALANLFLPSIQLDDNDWFSFLQNNPDRSLAVGSQYLAATAILGGYVWLVFGFLSRRCERQADVYGCKAVSCSVSPCDGHDGRGAVQSPALPTQDANAGDHRCANPWWMVLPTRALIALGILKGENLSLCSTGIRTFTQALERVADLNGIRRDKPSWRHSSIARRIDFLERLLKDPEVEPQFQRRLAVVKWALVVGLALLVGVLWHQGGVVMSGLMW